MTNPTEPIGIMEGGKRCDCEPAPLGCNYPWCLIDKLRAALFECFCYYGDGPVHEKRITDLLPNDEQELKRLNALLPRPLATGGYVTPGPPYLVGEIPSERTVTRDVAARMQAPAGAGVPGLNIKTEER